MPQRIDFKSGSSKPSSMRKSLYIVTALSLLVMSAGSAYAYHGAHVGVFIGVPGPWYYPPPVYYPPVYAAPPVVIEQQAPVYVEQPAQANDSAPAPSSDWYYCASSNTYYPYVKVCPEGWQRVAPQPPAP